jgi:hypothetical protein
VDERLRLSLWLVGGAGFGAFVGGVFGAVSGALHARGGYWAGTRLGRAVADAFTRTAERELSHVQQGTIAGAADGILFLGSLGIVAGFVLGTNARNGEQVFWVITLGSLFLVGGAVFFGGLAYALTNRDTWTFASVLGGGLLGAFLAALTLGADRLILGVVPGLFAGLLLSFTLRRYAPTFRSPQVGKVTPRLRADSETDVTQPPHPHRDNDGFQKRDPFEDE